MTQTTALTNASSQKTPQIQKRNINSYGFNSSYEASASEKISGNFSEVIGIGFLNDTENNINPGMKAQYSKNSTDENPIIKVIISKDNSVTQEYEINIKNINITNASEIEMFALCCYADDNGYTTGGTFGSWSTLRYYETNAVLNGYFKNSSGIEEAYSLKQDWKNMISKMMSDYAASGIFKQVMDGKGLLNLINAPYKLSTQKYPDKTMTDEQWKAFLAKIDKALDDYKKELERKIRENEEKKEDERLQKHKEMLYKMFSGSPSYIKKAWNSAADLTGIDGFSADFSCCENYFTQLQKYLFNIDGNPNNIFKNGKASALDFAFNAVEALNKEINKNSSDSLITDLKKEKEFYEEFINSLTEQGDTVNSEGAVGINKKDGVTEITCGENEENKNWYITCFTKDGITCTQYTNGVGKFIWSIKFTDEYDYQRVIDFLDKFDKNENLVFASKKYFWEDFLSGNVSGMDFLKY